MAMQPSFLQTTSLFYVSTSNPGEPLLGGALKPVSAVPVTRGSLIPGWSSCRLGSGLGPSALGGPEEEPAGPGTPVLGTPESGPLF